MYKIPVSNSPNQSFVCTVPVNGRNLDLKFSLWYNTQANYWLLSAEDVRNGKVLFSNLPMISSSRLFSNILYQLEYMKIGICIVLPIIDNEKSMPDDKNLGTGYLMIWGDNDGK